MKILLSGGGTLGSVSPLLALVEPLRAAGHSVEFVGTANGPERLLVEQAGVPFHSMTGAKWPRYFTWRMLAVPFQLGIAKWQALSLLLQLKPDMIVSAGGFVSVPLVWVGWALRIPSVVHQQDLRPGLAVRLMQPFVQCVTVAFEMSLRHFPARKAVWTGNPVRDLTPTTNAIQVDAAVPTVLIFGGGTGAQAINALVSPALCEFTNVIHVTGKGRDVTKFTHPRYHKFEFLGEEMKEALAKADVVVARAGLGTISELAALGKPAIIIPMPHTHQEQNAELLREAGAAVVLNQSDLNPTSFAESIRWLLQHDDEQAALGAAITSLQKKRAVQNFIDVLLNSAKQGHSN